MPLMTPLVARKISQPELFGSVPFFTAGRLSTLIPLLKIDSENVSHADDARIAWEWNNRVMGTPVSYEPKGPLNPFQIASYYADTATHLAQQLIVNSDSSAAVDLAVKWKVLGDQDALNAVIRILDAWSYVSQVNTTNDSPLVWSHQWPKFIQAALMVWDTPEYTLPLHSRLQNVSRIGILTSGAYNNTNNWAAWSLVNEFATGMFLQDRDRFDRAILRWRTQLDKAVVDNVPIEEVTRGGGAGSISSTDGSNGLWYSKFYLDAMTIAAEWARFSGEWLYDYTSPDGSSLKGLSDKVFAWTRYPDTFPYNTSGTPSTTTSIMAHTDILYALWGNLDAKWLIDKFKTGGPENRDTYGTRQWVLAYRNRPLYG